MKGYSTSARSTWSTSGLAAGTYRYSVWARDASSSATYDAYFPGVAYTVYSPCTSVSASATPTSSAPKGTTVTITSSASGCPNPQYEFWILPPGDSWTVVRGYSASSSFSWNTGGLAAGNYRYSVWVRDVGSGAAYDTYVPGTAYTLT